VIRWSLALAALAGCGNPYQDYQVSYNRAYCQALFRCCTVDQAMMRGPMASDESTCESVLNGGISSGSFQTGIDKGVLTFDSGHASTCLSSYTAALATCDAPVDVSTFLPACDQVVSGTVATGGDCLGSYECVPGDYCQLNFTSGACQPAAASGAACAAGGCLPGLACGVDGKCAGYLEVGATCDASTQCKSVSCVAMMTAGMCATQTVRQYLCGS
jgi:hypothetical protein